MVEGVAEAAKDPLRSCEVWLSRDVHVEAQMLDDVCDVGSSEGEVLERPAEASVGRLVTYRGAAVVGDLCLRVHRGHILYTPCISIINPISGSSFCHGMYLET